MAALNKPLPPVVVSEFLISISNRTRDPSTPVANSGKPYADKTQDAWTTSPDHKYDF